VCFTVVDPNVDEAVLLGFRESITGKLVDDDDDEGFVLLLLLLVFVLIVGCRMIEESEDVELDG